MISGRKVRALRKTLGLSAQQCAEMVGLSDGASWRRWERDGVDGVAAALIGALINSAAVRKWFLDKVHR